jgi:hypothetical protein
MSSRMALRWCAWSGLLAPVAFTFAWLAGGLAQPDAYSMIDHSVSDLGALTADSPWLYNQIGANLTGLLVVALAAGLWQTVPPRISGRSRSVSANGQATTLDRLCQTSGMNSSVRDARAGAPSSGERCTRTAHTRPLKGAHCRTYSDRGPGTTIPRRSTLARNFLDAGVASYVRHTAASVLSHVICTQSRLPDPPVSGRSPRGL